ncbi:hypothetical protein MKX03_019328 [Papaver bracteatum]|nr:hypothetical protein MKX03_019328 [Papaver bracteatum]
MSLKSESIQLAVKSGNLNHQQNFFNYISIRLQTAVSVLVRPTMTKETIKVPQVTKSLTYTGGCIYKKPKIRQAMLALMSLWKRQIQKSDLLVEHKLPCT